MLFLFNLILTIFYLALIVFCCVLFTNAIEHLGNKLKLSSNATGSILAVIGTTLPETLVPLVAILGAKLFLKNLTTGQDIALGGIIGSPFMLLCLALFLVGLEVLILYLFKKRQNLNLEINCKYVLRDLKYFLLAYIPALSCLFISNKSIKAMVVLFLIILYLIYVLRTIIKSKQNFCEENLEELIFARFIKLEKEIITVIFQIVVSLFILVLAIHYFVCEINYFSALFNISPVILSLIITPFATELPECVNSLIWVKNNKDDLALFNINGAVVFQAIIPMSIGIILTPFKYSPIIALNGLFVILSSLIFILSALIYKKINCISLLICGIFYFLFIGYLIFQS